MPGVPSRLVLAAVLALAAPPPVAGAAGAVEIATPSPPTSLAGPWRFRTGDDPAWASPALDDAGWRLLPVPGDWGRHGYGDYAGIAWYRLTLRLPPDPGLLAVTIGRIHSAYELYADGERIGGRGRFPPAPVARYDHEASWPLPSKALADGEVVLALRVYRGADLARGWQGGPYEGDFLVGRIDELVARQWRARHLALVLAALYLVIGLYHLHLHRRRRALREYLWYGLLTIAIGVYAVLTSQWKHDLALPWMALKRAEYANLYLLAPLAIETMVALLGVRAGRLVRGYQLSFVVLAVMALVAPHLLFLFRTLDVWQVLILPSVLGLPALVVRKAIAGHAEARTVLAGVLLFAVTALNDLAVDLRLLSTPRLVPLGFAAFIVSMAVSLADRFTRVFAELEEKTRALEATQAELLRTGKLSAIGGMAAGLVHDLRNPVAAIHSYATLISATSTPEQKRMLERILDETSRSVDMMEDVLAFARGSVRVTTQEVALGPWLSDIVARLRRDLELSMVDVTLVGDTGGTAVLDPARLRRVLANLAWNARDALPDGGRFEIAVARRPDRLVFTCTDDGPGVPDAVRDRLFTEFATHGKANGTGLGLALSRRIVVEHGGDIRYEDAPSGGARFVIELPQPPAAAVPPPGGEAVTLDGGGGRPPAPAGSPDRSAS